MPNVLRRPIAPLALAALLFLIAQFGAMAHGYSHDATAGGTVFAAGAIAAPGTALDSAARTVHPAGVGGHDACNDCLGFSLLMSAAGAPAALPALEVQRLLARVHATPPSPLARRFTPAFRSRAPPAA